MKQRRSARRSRLRAALLGPGPLGRPVDRVHAVARVVLGVLLLATIPLAIGVSTAVHARAGATAAAQRAERSTVQATLLATPPSVPSTSDSTLRAAATWRAAGRLHEGPVPVLTSARRGSVVQVWVDRRGNPTTAPLGDGDVAAMTLSAAVLAAICWTTPVCAAHGLLVAALDRRRMRAWATEWATVEPLWSTRAR